MGSILHLCRQSGASYFANENTWIESVAVEQLQNCMHLAGMLQVVGMPDLHASRVHPIGAAFLSHNYFYPALIGSDIGCGMGFYQTDLSVKNSVDKLLKRLGNIDAALTEDDIHALDSDLLPLSDGHYAMGNIGGGNHFAELQQVDTVFDEALFAKANLNKQSLQLLVHSGSRGLGQAILNQYVSQHGQVGLAHGSKAAEDYWTAHDEALRYAIQNRHLIAKRILNNLYGEGELILDRYHNFLQTKEHEGEVQYLHRKGAAASDEGLVMIPGSRGDYSYLVLPKPQAISLYSVAHGAGRKWKRKDCKGRLDKQYHYRDLQRTSLGSRVVCESRELLYEEAPQAYKSITTVIDTLEAAGLVQVVARFKPIISYKTRNKECC